MDLEIKKLENGDLELSIPEKEHREELQEFIDDSKSSYWHIMADLFEDYACNGEFVHFDASQGNPYVGLTDCPCIAESMDVTDDGQNVIEGEFWFFADYVTQMETELLAAGEKVIYTLSR